MSKRFRVVAACLLFLLMVRSERALATYWIATDIDYSTSSGVLSGYSETWKDAWEPDFETDCWWWQWDEIWGPYCAYGYMHYYQVYVVASVYDPAWIPWGSGQALAWRDAYAGYAFSPTQAGIWHGLGDHYVRITSVFSYCDPYYGCYPAWYEENWQYLGPTADQAIVPPPPVTIEYTMLIPLDHVRMPAPWETLGLEGRFFDGDNTLTHTPDADDYRIQQKFVIDTVNKTVASLGNVSGVTRGYYPAQSHLSSTASCLRKDCPECPTYGTGRKIVFEGYCKIPGGEDCALIANDMHTIVESVTESSPTTVTVEFGGDPGNDCLFISWDISWANKVKIRWDGSSPQYELTMEHDGFPLHELRINGSLVYSHDPISTGNTPNALANPKDINAPTQSGSLP